MAVPVVIVKADVIVIIITLCIVRHLIAFITTSIPAITAFPVFGSTRPSAAIALTTTATSPSSKWNVLEQRQKSLPAPPPLLPLCLFCSWTPLHPRQPRLMGPHGHHNSCLTPRKSYPQTH